MPQKPNLSIRRIAGWIASHELWILMIAAPFMIFPFGRLPYISLGLVVITWLCRWITHGRLSVSTGVDAPIAIILAMAILGYAISVEPSLSYTRFWSLTLGLVVYYGVVNSLKSEKQIYTAASALAVLMIGITGIGMLGTDWQRTRLIDIPWLYNHLPTLIRGLPNSGAQQVSDLIHPRLVGISMGVLVSVFLALLFFSRNRTLRILSGVIIVVGTGLLFITQTLAGLAGVSVALLFLLAWRNRWFLLAIPVGLAGVITGLYVAGFTRVLQYILSVNNVIGIAVTLRLDMWSRALAMIGDMPYTGIGLNTFSSMLSNFYPGYLLGPEPHAHNLFLQTALDLGLPGLAALLWLLVAWIYLVWRKYQATDNAEYRILLLGLVAGVLAYISHGFMDAMMIGSKPGVILWILLGIGAAPIMPEERRGQAATVKTKTNPRLILLTAIILVIPMATIIINPAPIYMNIGAIQAHRALYQTLKADAPNLPGLDKARGMLLRVLSYDKGYLSAYELLGRIYAWQGIQPLAMNAFSHRVALDGQDPFFHYFPSQHWLEEIQGTTGRTGEWESLVDIYSHWLTRFPERAELYVEMGIAWQCNLNDPATAANWLQTGMEKKARPAGLLEYYQEILSQKDRSFCITNK